MIDVVCSVVGGMIVLYAAALVQIMSIPSADRMVILARLRASEGQSDQRVS